MALKSIGTMTDKRVLDDIEKRLRSVEAFINNLKGRMFVTGFLAGGGVTVIIWLLTRN